MKERLEFIERHAAVGRGVFAVGHFVKLTAVKMVDHHSVHLDPCDGVAEVVDETDAVADETVFDRAAAGMIAEDGVSQFFRLIDESSRRPQDAAFQPNGTVGWRYLDSIGSFGCPSCRGFLA